MRTITLCILGIFDAGKSTLVHSFFKRNYAPESTLGAAFFVHTYKDRLTLNIWDTAGQERYASLLPMYTRSAQILLFVIDPTNRDSLAYFKKTIAPIIAAKRRAPPKAIHIVITKYDTQTNANHSKKLIQEATEHLEELLVELVIPSIRIRSFITSARTDKDVDLPFLSGLDELDLSTTLIIEPLLLSPEDSSTSRRPMLQCCGIQ
jgi:small GTP-binding protein